MIRYLLILLAVLCAPLAAGEASATAPANAPPPRPKVAYIPIEGVIDEHRASQFDRALTAALDEKPDVIVVKVTTDGGAVHSAMDMVRAELRAGAAGVKLAAFIDNRAYSAGALISYGCSRIYMTSSASIGDIGVIFINQAEGKVEYAPEKFETPVRSLLRQCGQHNGWSEAKLQKMTARNQELWQVELQPGKPEWVIEDDLPQYLHAHPELERKDKMLLREGKSVGFLAYDKDRLLTYSAAEAVVAGMATAVVSDIADVYRALGADPAQVIHHEPTQHERIAETLGGWAPLLAGLAILFVILEFKVPSGGLWLIGAGVCGVAFLVTQYWLQLAGAPEVILIGLGLVAVILELFVLPTGGLLGAGGLLAMGIGLILAFMPDGIQFHPGTEGWGSALGGALVQSLLSLALLTVGIVIAIATLPRTRAMRVLASPAAIAGSSAGAIEAAAPSLVGRRVRARSELRPGGYVDVDGRDISATAEHGAMVEAGTEVEIVESRFGELVVRPVPPAGKPA